MSISCNNQKRNGYVGGILYAFDQYTSQCGILMTKAGACEICNTIICLVSIYTCGETRQENTPINRFNSQPTFYRMLSYQNP